MWKNDFENYKLDRNERNFQLLMVTNNVLAEVDVVLMGLEFI